LFYFHKILKSWFKHYLIWEIFIDALYVLVIMEVSRDERMN
jgi:hypothetical protein